MLQVAAELVHHRGACNLIVQHMYFTVTMKRALKPRWKTVGTFKYATDSTTDVLCCAYAVDEGPVKLWTCGDPVPAEFVEAATNPAWVVAAHGAHFEDLRRTLCSAPSCRLAMFPGRTAACTQAMALAVGLPARLSLVAIALELSNRKDAAGERLDAPNQQAAASRTRTRTRTASTGLIIRNGSIGCTHIASKISKSNASSIPGCRPCRRSSR